MPTTVLHNANFNHEYKEYNYMCQDFYGSSTVLNKKRIYTMNTANPKESSQY